MKKEKIVFLVGIISILISSTISVYAANYLYNSKDVEYDNTNKNITSDNVQGAIDELYIDANNYSSINDRVNTLESKMINHYIQSNTDLNTITTVGTYYVDISDVVSTFSNCPTNDAFSMYVTPGIPTQIIVTYWADVYIRSYRGWRQTDPWTNWFKLTNQAL